MTTGTAGPPELAERGVDRAGTQHPEDLALVRRILDGDEQAWSRFVQRYAGLILAMARRYLYSRDPDEARGVMANVLESLRRRRLRTYEGRAALSTWLTLVARSHVLDHLRHQFGRDLKFKALDRLSQEERHLFRLYYVEGLNWKEVVERLGDAEDEWTVDRFVNALHDLERKLGERWLKRLSYDLHAQSVGAASGRLLEYLDHVRDEFSQTDGARSPEYELMEKEARRTVDDLRASITRLTARDRQLVELRFERGWTAKRIAAELGMNGQKSVYKSIDRIVARLRKLLTGSRR